MYIIISAKAEKDDMTERLQSAQQQHRHSRDTLLAKLRHAERRLVSCTCGE